MLISQTIFTSVGFGTVVDAEGSKKNIHTDISFKGEDGNDVNPEEYEGDISVVVDWSVKKEDIEEIEEGYKETIELSLPKQIQLEEGQSDHLVFEETEVAIYTALANGIIEVEFNDEVEVLELEELEGTFTLQGEIEAEEVDEEEEIVEEDPVETEDSEEPKETEETDEVTEEENNEAADEVEENESISITADSVREAQSITENIIDELRLIKEDGSTYEEGDFLELDEDLRLELDWSLPNGHEYQAGDTFEFQLPDGLTIYNDFDGDLNGYGTYHVTTNGEVTFTFSERIENESDIKGTFWTDTELNEQVVKKTTEELEFVFNDEVIEKITINVKPKDGQAIQKNGQPVNGNFNTEEIEWTVIVNTTREALENAVVNDPILGGQELILDSIDLKEVDVNLQGHVIEGSEKDANYEENNSTLEKLELELGNTDKAYKLTFKTKMKEEEKDKEGSTSYSNTAYLNSDGKDQAQNGASVSVNRPKSLEKTSSAFDKGDRSVAWEVKANFTEKELSAGTEIVDEFTFTIGDENRSDAFEITKDDIEILQVDSFGDNGAVGETSDAKGLFDISIDGNKVTYKLNEDSNKAFIIKYETTAKKGTYINDDGTISNTVGIDGKTETSSQGVYQQVGVKTNNGINYKDKTIDWTITVNADSQELRNFILTDDFSGTGQKLVDGSIEIEPDEGNAQINLNPEEIPEGEGFEIDFGTITQPYTITYQTEFTYDFEGEKTPEFKNGVHVSYTTTDDEPYELDFGNEVDPNEETKSNGAKNNNVNNETKEITWFIDINYNQLELDNAKLIDEIADNQSLVGNVEVYETSIARDGEVDSILVGTEVTDLFDITEEENLVEVDFGEIDQSYRVVFVTKDKDGIYNSDEVYENTAQFIPREDEVHNLYANATLPNQGEFLGKNGFHNRDEWTIDWELTVNESKSTLTDATVTDNLGDELLQILLEDSIEVTKVGSDDALVEGEDYEVVVDGNELSVKFPGVITDTYSINYSSYILAAETADISNEAAIKSVEDTIVGNVESEETVQVRISTGGGSGEGTTGELVLEKVESDTDRVLENVAFTLKRTIGNQEVIVREDTTDENGKIHWTGLQFGDYTLEEVIPEGYLGEETQEITLSSDAPEGIQTITIENERQTGTASIEKVDANTGEKLDGAVFEITNLVTGQTYTLTTEDDGTVSEEVPFGEYTVEEITAPNGYRNIEDIENIIIEIDETTTIEVVNEAIVEVAGQKTWISDEGLDLPVITVELLANGTKVDDTQVSANTNWEYSFTNLDKYDENGEEIEYTIEEVEVDGFITQQIGFDLTNIQTVAISGEKNWIEVDEQYRPDSITVNLLADGEEINAKEVEADDEGEWTFSFIDLPKFDTEGHEIEYTIEEEAVTGYTSEIEDYTITNTQESIELSGTKTWLDNNSEDRPETITVQVKNGETVVQDTAVEADEDGEWNYTFTDLPKYDKEGNEITYTVDEIEVEGYEKSIDGNDITNLRVDTTEVNVTKLWKDEHENDRPDAITINLLQNGVHYEEYEVTAENGWERTITDLPQYDEEGVEYEYTITEHDVPGYEAEVDGFDITNTRTDVKAIEINKSWLDDDSEDRPDSIEVELFRSVTDGELESVEVYTVTAEDDWSLEVKDLPAFDKEGNAYTYEIAEKAVEGYEATINGFDITNLRVGDTEVSGEKTWIEVDDKYRPEAITVQLLANEEKVDKTEVTAEDDWKYSFTNLAKFDTEGREIQYTVVEENVLGYVSVVDGTNITNTQESTSLSGEKKWVEVDERYRPDSINVTLLANGEVEGELEITAEDDWIYTFNHLAKYDTDGNIINYTVVEDEVPGYVSEVDGVNITNTQEKTSLSGIKTWVEVDDRYRPESITVTLLANEEFEADLKVSEKDDWIYTFENLAKYDTEGNEISYTVVEDEVPGYQSEVDRTNITNTQETTEISGTKTWKDDDSEARPDSITVQVMNGEHLVDQQEVTAADDWNFTFTDLAKYDAEGKEIEYTINELPVPGYATAIDGTDITNTRAEEVDVEGTKTWLDDDSTSRPKSITVELLANGEKEDSVKVNAESDWTYQFTDLPAYDEDGVAIVYSVDEVAVDGYETTINGYDITNIRTGSTSVDVEKVWENDQAENRPDNITVDLLQNDKVIETVEITSEDDWTHQFTDLPAYDDNGVAYEYTIEEHDVEGYESTINATDSGYTITNTFIEEPEESGKDPKDPTDPTKPEEEPKDPKPGVDPKDPGQTGDTTETGNGESLPKTATNTFNMLLIGGLLLALGTGFILFRRKQA